VPAVLEKHKEVVEAQHLVLVTNQVFMGEKRMPRLLVRNQPSVKGKGESLNRGIWTSHRHRS